MKLEDKTFHITADVLLKAYRCGIFPMAEDADCDELFWIEPDFRGHIPLNEFHIPKSLKKAIRKQPFDVRIDTDFEGVISGCAGAAPERPTTWINSRIKELYHELFEKGFCHTVECWQDGELVGGLYGVALEGAFFGESMFSKVTDASKIALVYLVARLKYADFKLLDTQFITDHLMRFGAKEMDRETFQRRLNLALEAGFKDFSALSVDTAPSSVLQLVSQTS